MDSTARRLSQCMPRIQRSNIPPNLLLHLFRRIRERGVTSADIVQLAHWLDAEPTVPDGPWYKRFPGFIVCGHGPLIKTFLTPQQTAIGTEIE